MPRELQYPDILQVRLPADGIARLRRALPVTKTPSQWAREQLLAALDRIEEAKEGES